jgi:hypothetical protein
VLGLHLALDQRFGLVDLVLSVLDVLLILLNAVDVEQVVLLQLGELLVQLVRLSEKQIVNVILIRQLHQIQIHQLIKSRPEPRLSHISPVNLFRLLALARLDASGLGLQETVVNVGKSDVFVSFLVLLKDNVVLRLVFVVLAHPSVEGLHLLVFIAFVTNGEVVIRRQLKQEILILLQIS